MADEPPDDMSGCRRRQLGCCDAAFLAFLLLGTATLFPWNALITAADYWEAVFPGKHIDRLFTVAYLPVNLAVLAAMIRWHAAVRPRLRIIGGLSGFTLAMLAVPLVDLAGPSPATLAALLLLVAGVGACDGMAQGALFGEAALLPPRFTQALVSGTSLSGVAVSLLRLATKATLPDTQGGLRASATLYFLLAAAVCFASMATYLVLHHLPVVAVHKATALAAALAEGVDAGSASLEADMEEEQQRATAEVAGSWEEERQGSKQRRHPGSVDVELSYEDHMHDSSPLQQQRRLGKSNDDDAAASASAHEALLPHGQHMHAAVIGERGGGRQATGWAADGWGYHGNAASEVWEAAVPIWRLIAANCGIYVITLSIFPGVLAEDVTSAELGSWYPVALITLFNLADCLGKCAPAVEMLRLRAHSPLLAAAAARLIFVPAFHLSTSRGAGAVATGALTLLLGLSNGYLTSCTMIAAPEGLRGRRAALVGNLMVFALVTGLCLGAACGFLWLL